MRISNIERWRSSERIAEEVLRRLGFEVIEHHKRIIIDGFEVGEVDFVARHRNGELYAVEVKAGKIDITGLRQAYVNAKLVGMKPMVICKGFADDSARELAKVLGIEVVQLSDLLLVEDEELETIVREAVEEAFSEYLEMLLLEKPALKEHHLRVLEAIAQSSSISEAAEKLGIDVQDVTKILSELRSQGVVPKWAKRWSSIKRVAKFVVSKATLHRDLEALEKAVMELSSVVDKLQRVCSSLSKYVAIMERSSSPESYAYTRSKFNDINESERGSTSSISPS